MAAFRSPVVVISPILVQYKSLYHKIYAYTHISVEIEDTLTANRYIRKLMSNKFRAEMCDFVIKWTHLIYLIVIMVQIVRITLCIVYVLIFVEFTQSIGPGVVETHWIIFITDSLNYNVTTANGMCTLWNILHGFEPCDVSQYATRGFCKFAENPEVWLKVLLWLRICTSVSRRVLQSRLPNPKMMLICIYPVSQIWGLQYETRIDVQQLFLWNVSLAFHKSWKHLTHRSRVTHIRQRKSNTASDDGLSPIRHQGIIFCNVDILSVEL